MPSAREWIAVGGFSQWDHYGDVALAPKISGAPPAKTKTPPAKKQPAKKPATRR